jgi:hypothetical protein
VILQSEVQTGEKWHNTIPRRNHASTQAAIATRSCQRYEFFCLVQQLLHSLDSC